MLRTTEITFLPTSVPIRPVVCEKYAEMLEAYRRLWRRRKRMTVPHMTIWTSTDIFIGPFLPHLWHPSWYSSYKPGDILWMRKIPGSAYDK